MPISLSDVLARLRGNGKKPATAAAIADALAKIDVAALAEAALAAEVARREAVLCGKPETEIERLEAAMVRARVEHERAEIASDALRVQLAEAQEREEGELLDRDLAAAHAETMRVGGELAAHYEEAATKIAAAFAAASETRERIESVNARLRRAGRHDQTVPMPADVAFTATGRFVAAPDAEALTSLVPIGRFRGLGEARRIHEVLGVTEAAE